MPVLESEVSRLAKLFYRTERVSAGGRRTVCILDSRERRGYIRGAGGSPDSEHTPVLRHSWPLGGACATAGCKVQLCSIRSALLLLQAADFGPRTALKVVDTIREGIRRGTVKTPDEMRTALRASIIKVLKSPKGSTSLELGSNRPGVILVVGVNGGGKTTTIGKLAHKLQGEGAKVGSHIASSLCIGHPGMSRCRQGLPAWARASTYLRLVAPHAACCHGNRIALHVMFLCACSATHTCSAVQGPMLSSRQRGCAGRLMHARMQVLLAAGDTFRAAAAEQLQGWAERSGAQLIARADAQQKPASLLSAALDRVRALGIMPRVCAVFRCRHSGIAPDSLHRLSQQQQALCQGGTVPGHC